MAAYTETTAYKLPTRVAQDDSNGTAIWDFEDRVFVEGSFIGATSGVFTTIDPIVVDQARLVFADVVASNNEAADENVALGDHVYGGASDLWGESSVSGLQASNQGFGFAISMRDTEGTETSNYYLVMTGYDFDLPDDAVIDGIEVDSLHSTYASGGGTQSGEIDTAKMRLYFSWDIKATAQGEAVGMCYVDPPRKQVQRKSFRYRVTNAAGEYVGDWQDASETPEFTQEVNNGLSSLEVPLARNDQSTANESFELITEAEDELITENAIILAVDTQSPVGVGEGTNLDLNYNVNLDTFYGEFVGLLTEDDEPMYSEAGDLVTVAEGRPLGRQLFNGYVARWDLSFGKKPSMATVFSHSHELKHIILETADTVAESNTNESSSTVGVSGGGPTDNQIMGQTFNIGSTITSSRIRLKMRGNISAGSSIDAAMVVKTGATQGSGTTVASASVTITTPRDEDPEAYDFVFDEPVELTSGNYHFEITQASGFPKTGGNPTYPVQAMTSGSDTYASGTAFVVYSKSSPTYQALSDDFYFEVYEAGGDTEVPFLSKDPSYILQQVLDFAKSRGARVEHTTETIEPTGTLVSYTFNSNTIYEAIEKCLELAPQDWYWYYDFGTNEVNFKPRPSETTRTMTLRRNVVNMNLQRDIEDIVNEVYFTGGVDDISAGDNALFIKTLDTVARGEWRRGLKQVSDQRVKDADTAAIISQFHIDQAKDPRYTGTLDFIGVDEYIEDVGLGELVRFAAFGNLVDQLELQIMRITYKTDTLQLTLDTLKPKITKRIEDIKRNLDQKEREFNPTAPS